jgi:hypothetical protein
MVDNGNIWYTIDTFCYGKSIGWFRGAKNEK